MLPVADPSLAPFFAPQGVVLIGATADPTKLGYGIAQNMVGSGYAGSIHFVNPHGGTLFGQRIHARIGEIPDPVDLAVILIPPEAVLEALRGCAARGIRAAVIASGGFREAGPEGAALEEACLATAQEADLRLIGPNCIGLIDTHLPLDTTFLPPPTPAAGEIAFISHSGAICAAVIDWSRGQGFGFSRVVSLGNQVDVSETDVLPAVAADPHTRAITLYLEAISDGRRFVKLAQQITPHKPIVVLKAGRTAAGRQAAASHTGALAGSQAAFNTAMRHAGVHQASSTNEMFAWARALAASGEFGTRNAESVPHSTSRTPHSALQVAVLTNAGGPGVLAADAIEAHDLALAALADETQAQLRQILPPAASVSNPVDMLASASPEQYAAGLRRLLSDAGVDAVLVILPPPPMFTAGAVARAIIPLIQTADKPVVVALMGHGLVGEALAFLRAVKIPTYTFPEMAVGALRAISDQRSFASRPRLPVAVDHEWPASISPVLTAVETSWLPQQMLFDLLAAYGIKTAESRIVRSPAEAAAAAEAIGYPVALKISAPNIAHKSDRGGVYLDLQDAREVLAASENLAKVGGDESHFLVQQMIAGGQELIAGITRDPQFGPLLMVGSGGVEVEGLNDVAFALAPVSAEEARALLRQTWAGRKLAGYRSIPAADETAVVNALVGLCRLALDHPDVDEIEINPLIALPQGAVAVDVRARRAQHP